MAHICKVQREDTQKLAGNNVFFGLFLRIIIMMVVLQYGCIRQGFFYCHSPILILVLTQLKSRRHKEKHTHFQRAWSPFPTSQSLVGTTSSNLTSSSNTISPRSLQSSRNKPRSSFPLLLASSQSSLQPLMMRFRCWKGRGLRY